MPQQRPFFCIAGPCVIESRDMALSCAAALPTVLAQCRAVLDLVRQPERAD